jgi:hypothetical protein
MHERFIRVAAAMLVLAAFGCGGRTNVSDTWTCYDRLRGFCYENSAPSYLSSSEVSQLQQSLGQNCTASGGKYSTGSDCPTESRVGTCVISEMVHPERQIPYNWGWYAPNHSAETGQTFCSGIKGTWIPD